MVPPLYLRFMAATTRKRGVALKDVRAIALALPEATEGTSYGTVAFHVKKKLFARMLEDGESLVIKCDPDQREVLVSQRPETFVVTPHYEPYPMVIIRLKRIDRPLLRKLLQDAWGFSAPATLRANH